MEKSNHIRVYRDIVVFYELSLSGKPHANHAVKVIVGATPLSVSYEQEVIKAQGVIIRSDTVHKVKGGKGPVTSLYINPHTRLGKSINSRSTSNLLMLTRKSSALLLKYFDNSLGNHLTESDIKSFLNETLLGEATSEAAEIFHDERIRKIVDHIESAPNYDVRFADLLRICNLSESRLIHLFKAEIGITIRKYILWRRVQKALAAMCSGRSIRQSAQQAGFTDAAHFNRTFVSMFGLNPSATRK